jgi:hypothetical protein
MILSTLEKTTWSTGASPFRTSMKDSSSRTFPTAPDAFGELSLFTASSTRPWLEEMTTTFEPASMNAWAAPKPMLIKFHSAFVRF